MQARSQGTAGGYHFEGVDGELQVLNSGNEDEDVDIDDEDCDAVQHLEDSQGNGTCQGPSVTGASPIYPLLGIDGVLAFMYVLLQKELGIWV